MKKYNKKFYKEAHYIMKAIMEKRIKGTLDEIFWVVEDSLRKNPNTIIFVSKDLVRKLELKAEKNKNELETILDISFYHMVSGNIKIDYTAEKKVTCSAIFAPMSSDYYQLRELDGYDVKYDCSRAKAIKFLMIE